MPRQALTTVENNFVGGLKTEYTGLNFPENSVVETDNCVFERTGRVTRRLGIDLESNGTYNTQDRTGGVVTSYVWLNAAGDGFTNLLVTQIGGILYFYEASDTSTALDSQLLASTITLSAFISANSVGTTPAAFTDECQFSQGNGFLFVFHPHLEPFYVSYNPTTQVVTGTIIPIQIRDFGGIPEAGVSDTERPTSLTTTHRYNLGNQGWKSGWVMTSTTNITVGTGSKTFVTNLGSNVMPIKAGDRIKVKATSNPTAFFMLGVVTSFSTSPNNLVVKVTSSVGDGTAIASWTIVQQPDDITTWNTAVSNFPSNSDIWWSFKNASNVFQPSTTINNVSTPTSPASKGHYIVNPFELNRSLTSGVQGLTVESTAGERPATGAFFAGRLFFAGIKSASLHNSIYFSQIIEGTDQFGKCYQTNDPTSEDFFDLLPTDGGIISIQNAGTIVKLFATKSMIIVFATNGIWAITGTGGTDGLGFAATDYSVNKISIIKTQSATSFIEVQNVIAWWNVESIYTLEVSGDKGAQIESMTNTTIASFYNNIPSLCKLKARGAYNPITFIAQWVYRSATPNSIKEQYEFDRVLNFNVLTKAFYTWSINPSNAGLTVNGVVALDATGGNVLQGNVVAGAGNQVIAGAGNNVITLGLSSNINTINKYIISKPDGAGSFKVSFGEAYRTSYHDWVSEDSVGINYNSDFTTAFAVHGEAQKFFSLNWLNVYSDSSLTTGNSAFSIQGIWDFANSSSVGRISNLQTTQIPANTFDITRRRFRIRGKGMSCQLKFANVSSFPFSIIGWSKLEMKNAVP